MITNGDNFQGLQCELVSWNPERPMVWFQSQGQMSWNPGITDVSVRVNAGKSWCPSSKALRQKELSLISRRVRFFVLFRPSTDWMRPTHIQFSSVAQPCLTLCDPMNCSTQAPCPSPTPGVHAHSHPSSWWCHPAISSSVIPFSSCPQSLPASESFPMNTRTDLL